MLSDLHVIQTQSSWHAHATTLNLLITIESNEFGRSNQEIQNKIESIKIELED